MEFWISDEAVKGLTYSVVGIPILIAIVVIYGHTAPLPIMAQAPLSLS